MINNEMNPIQTPFNLPFEINKNICDYLDTSSLNKLSSCCKLFDCFYENNVFWMGKKIGNVPLDDYRVKCIRELNKGFFSSMNVSPNIKLEIQSFTNIDSIKKQIILNRIKCVNDFVLKITIVPINLSLKTLLNRYLEFQVLTNLDLDTKPVI